MLTKSSAEPPAAGATKEDFVWISHDAADPKSSSQRHTVFSHVQSNYRAQRRRIDTKAVRASALKGRTAALSDPTLRRLASKEGASNHARSSEGSTPPPQDVVSEEPLGFLVRAISPIPFLKKGNTDPFRAYPIFIGPKENELIGLYRDHVLPSVYHLRISDKNLNDKNFNELAERDWDDNVRTLQEEGTALASLARYSSIAGRTNPLMRQTSLNYLGRSTRGLREKIFQSRSLNTHEICMHINSLFNAEIINENLAGAVAHGRMLQYIFKQQWEKNCLDYKMLMYQLHNDMQLTATLLTRPIFDEGDWLSMVLKPLWDAAAPHLPTFPDSDDDIDPTIDNEVLLHWFKQRRNMIQYEGVRAADKLVPSLPLVTTSFMASSFLFHGRMIGHYLDTEEELEEEGLSVLIKTRLYAREFLALASAHLRRWTGYSPQNLGVLIYDNKRIVRALRYALEQYDFYSTESENDRYHRAEVWALYVGALVERSTLRETDSTSQQWFTKRLTERALEMQITTWTDLTGLLDHFLYEESLMSQGALWFETELQILKRQEEARRS